MPQGKAFTDGDGPAPGIQGYLRINAGLITSDATLPPSTGKDVLNQPTLYLYGRGNSVGDRHAFAKVSRFAGYYPEEI
jgi:hypothetical protein